MSYLVSGTICTSCQRFRSMGWYAAARRLHHDRRPICRSTLSDPFLTQHCLGRLLQIGVMTTAIEASSFHEPTHTATKRGWFCSVAKHNVPWTTLASVILLCRERIIGSETTDVGSVSSHIMHIILVRSKQTCLPSHFCMSQALLSAPHPAPLAGMKRWRLLPTLPFVFPSLLTLVDGMA